MTRLPLLIATLALAGCSTAKVTTALQSPPGQLFCSIQTSGGGAFTAGLVAAALTGAVPTAGPLVVIATNAGKAAVDADCAKAAQTVAGGVSGVAVSPPAVQANVPQVAIVAPASPVVAQ